MNKQIFYQNLIEYYGNGNWKKFAGEAPVLDLGEKFIAEIHYYEAKGIGRVDFKIDEDGDEALYFAKNFVIIKDISINKEIEKNLYKLAV